MVVIRLVIISRLRGDASVTALRRCWCVTESHAPRDTMRCVTCHSQPIAGGAEAFSRPERAKRIKGPLLLTKNYIYTQNASQCTTLVSKIRKIFRMGHTPVCPLPVPYPRRSGGQVSWSSTCQPPEIIFCLYAVCSGVEKYMEPLMLLREMKQEVSAKNKTRSKELLNS